MIVGIVEKILDSLIMHCCTTILFFALLKWFDCLTFATVTAVTIGMYFILASWFCTNIRKTINDLSNENK